MAAMVWELEHTKGRRCYVVRIMRRLEKFCMCMQGSLVSTAYTSAVVLTSAELDIR